MLKRLAILLFTVVIIISACRKSDRQEDKDVQSSVDYLQAQTYFVNTATHVFELLRNRPEIYLDADTANHYPGTCPSIAITPAYPDSMTYPKTIVIDYGTVNCSGADGFRRRGKLNVVLNVNPIFSSSQITISPNNFFINDKEVRGGITLSRNANTTSGHAMYTETVSNGEVHVSENLITYYKANLMRERLSGDTTRTVSDDEYSITGSGSGYATRGASYIYTIKTALNVKPGCAYFDNGSVSMRPGNLAERIIDLGSGCNSAASVTIFAESQEISFD